jgi:hypothetical protein
LALVAVAAAVPTSFSLRDGSQPRTCTWFTCSDEVNLGRNDSRLLPTISCRRLVELRSPVVGAASASAGLRKSSFPRLTASS